MAASSSVNPPIPHPVKRRIRKKLKKNHACIHPGCNKSFACHSWLARHILTHTGQKPHVCKDCDTRFAEVSTLNVHKLLHTGEKPHVCEECGRAFSQIGNLNVHKLLHTGERPHKCEYCGACFTQSCHLTTHKFTHTGEKSHACDECDARFARKSNLTAHKRCIHTARGKQRQKKREENLARFLTESGITFEREVVVNFCQEAERKYARVDFTIYREWGTDILECDEDQHTHYDIGCDAGRMLNVFAETLKRGDHAGRIRFLRFNPDSYKRDGEKQKTCQRDRRAALLKVLNTPPAQQFSVSYLFYDRTGPLPDCCLAPEYPSTLRAISSAAD